MEKCNREFFYEFYLFSASFRRIKFYDLVHTFLNLKQLFLRIPLNFSYGVINNYIYPPWYLKRKNKMIHVHHNKLQIWPIYGLLVTFMAFKLKLMAFPIKLTPNGQNQGKNNRKIKFYIAAFAFFFKKNFSRFQFFWVPWRLL